jgi:hypothetical protein
MRVLEQLPVLRYASIVRRNMIVTYAELGLRGCILCLVPQAAHHLLPLHLLRFKTAVFSGYLHEVTPISQHLDF